MDNLFTTPMKSIRKKCLDCSVNQPKEVRKCPVINCALYPYRMGKRPSDSTLESMKLFYGENREPCEEFPPFNGKGGGTSGNN